MAALGMETGSGDFEVIDVCFAGLPDVFRPEAGPSKANGHSASNGKGKARAKDGEMDVDGAEKTWVAVVSGLNVGAQEAPADLKAQLLIEWLMGEGGGLDVCRLLLWTERS